jgi:hypothetical protein
MIAKRARGLACERSPTALNCMTTLMVLTVTVIIAIGAAQVQIDS